MVCNITLAREPSLFAAALISLRVTFGLWVTTCNGIACLEAGCSNGCLQARTL